MREKQRRGSVEFQTGSVNLCCSAHKDIATRICKQGIKKEESTQLLVKGTVNVSTLLKNAEMIMELIAAPLMEKTNYNNSLSFSPS